MDQPFWDYRDGLQLSYTLPNGIQLKSMTGFQQRQWNALSLSCDCDDPASGVGYEYVPRDDYYSQEFDVLSPSRQLHLDCGCGLVRAGRAWTTSVSVRRRHIRWRRRSSR
jgi:hypothetical protein